MFKVQKFKKYMHPIECMELRRRSTIYARSKVLENGQIQETDIRTSSSAGMINDDMTRMMSGKLDWFLKQKAGLEFSSTSSLQIIRYYPKEFFHRHMDALEDDNEGHQRLYSALLYLNDDFTGGCTRFENEFVIPETGKLIVWNNVIPGTLEANPESYHSSEPVLSGIKYVALKLLYSTAPRSCLILNGKK
jgi:prolyl 4-hydroxylase